MTATPHRKRIGWAVGDFGFNIYWQALNLLMMPFYTDVLGLDPRLAGTVFLLASLWDGVADSVIGAVADRTRSRHGSYRPFLLVGTPFMVVAFMAAFAAPPWPMLGLFLYALLSQILMRTAYSVVQIPYAALGARVSGDADVRASMAGYRMMFAMAGGIAVTFLLPSIVDALNMRIGQNGWTYVVAAGIVGLVSLPIFWLCFRSTSEPERLEDANPEGFHWKAVGEDLATVLAILKVNGPLLRVFIVMIVSSLAFTMTNKCLTYYVNHWLERPDLRQFILPLALFTNLVCCPLWAWVAQRTCKRDAWLMASAVSIIAYALFWFVPTRDPLLAMGLIAAISVGNAAYLVLVWAMLPDTIEVTDLALGQRHDAKLFGIASFAKQLALGVNGVVLGFLLSAVGYVEQATVQSAEAIAGIRAIMSLLPMAGIALAAAIMWGYRLDQAEHARISALADAQRRIAQ